MEVIGIFVLLLMAYLIYKKKTGRGLSSVFQFQGLRNLSLRIRYESLMPFMFSLFGFWYFSSVVSRGEICKKNPISIEGNSILFIMIVSVILLISGFFLISAFSSEETVNGQDVTSQDRETKRQYYTRLALLVIVIIFVQSLIKHFCG